MCRSLFTLATQTILEAMIREKSVFGKTTWLLSSQTQSEFRKKANKKKIKRIAKTALFWRLIKLQIVAFCLISANTSKMQHLLSDLIAEAVCTISAILIIKDVLMNRRRETGPLRMRWTCFRLCEGICHESCHPPVPERLLKAQTERAGVIETKKVGLSKQKNNEIVCYL